MYKSTLLDDQLQVLASFEPLALPVLSLYLNTAADQHGRRNFDSFLRRELYGRARTYESGSPERVSFDNDVRRIEKFLAEELRPPTNALAIFACSGAGGFFEAVQLNATIDSHELYVYNQPHLYTLARLNDEFPRYAVVLTDTNLARIYVFGLSDTVASSQVESDKTKRFKAGGWSQARFQRNVDNFRQQHIKDVVEALDRVVREDNIEHIIFAGDEVAIPMLRDELPQHLTTKVVDVLKMDITASEQQMMVATLASMRRNDAETDAAAVQRMIDEYRAGGLATGGLRDVAIALTRGQVHELFISASPDKIDCTDAVTGSLIPDAELQAVGVSEADGAALQAKVADALVTKGKETSAILRFIEDPQLLEPVGGVGATLRYPLVRTTRR